MDGSAEMTAESAFIALVLMATALSFSTLRICAKQVNMYSCSDSKILTSTWCLSQGCPYEVLEGGQVNPAQCLAKIELFSLRDFDKGHTPSKLIDCEDDVACLV